MHDPKHPIWGFARLVVVMVALVITLWLNASHFDSTELKTIITMFIIAASTEGITGYLAQFVKHKHDVEESRRNSNQGR